MKMKETRIPCKNCGREFLHRMPLALYEAMLEAAKEDGEDLQLTGTCPTCQEDDPFFRFMNGIGSDRIKTIGSLHRHIKESK